MSGEAVKEGSRQGQRWCDECGCHHGPLYVCPTYPQSVKDEIAGHDAQFRRNLSDPVWRDEQRKQGIPSVAIDIMCALAGVKP